jgi:hypothetical protein
VLDVSDEARLRELLSEAEQWLRDLDGNQSGAIRLYADACRDAAAKLASLRERVAVSERDGAMWQKNLADAQSDIAEEVEESRLLRERLASVERERAEGRLNWKAATQHWKGRADALEKDLAAARKEILTLKWKIVELKQP